MKKIKVSIVCISYNQEKYITQALDGFVSQKTNFDFEAIVADDCSSDSTPKIINEYAKKYPNIIKPVLRKKNIGVQANLIDALNRATGDYIALCEGDDFWTDPKKLQLQVDFLEKYPDYSLCFHQVKVFFQNGEEIESIFPTIVDKEKFTIEELLKDNFIQTNSVMYRKQTYESIPNNILPVDWYLHLYHAQFGKIGFIDKVMSAYRRHSDSIWWGTRAPDLSFWKKYAQSRINFYDEVNKLFADRSESIRLTIAHSESILLLIIIDTCQQTQNGSKFIEELVIGNPAVFIELSQTLQKELENALELVQMNRDMTQQARREVALKDQDLEKVIQEVEKLRTSLSWRITRPMRFIGKIRKR